MMLKLMTVPRSRYRLGTPRLSDGELTLTMAEVPDGGKAATNEQSRRPAIALRCMTLNGDVDDDIHEEQVDGLDDPRHELEP